MVDTTTGATFEISVGDTRVYFVAAGAVNEVMQLDLDTNNVLLTPGTGNVGIGTSNPTNILTVQPGSGTDPIADSWTVYPSDRAHKQITRIDPPGCLTKMKACPLYEWTRKPLVSDEEAKQALGKPNPTPQELEAKKQELAFTKAKLPKFSTKRIGMVIDDPQVPPEILTTNPDGTTAGIDLLAYLGYLHAALKEAAERIDDLEARLNAESGR